MADATHTFRLHRVLRAPAERVYRAFLDPDAMAKWLPPHGFTGKVHQSDTRVVEQIKRSVLGALERMEYLERAPMDGAVGWSLANDFSGQSHISK